MLENDEEYKSEEDFNERRSIVDSTTIASKDDDDYSDFDELSLCSFKAIQILFTKIFWTSLKDNDEEVLVKPEFEGLWNKKLKNYEANDFYKIQQKFPTCFKTKAEKELYAKTLEKLKQSAVRDQIVGGKKFLGVSFKSQPKIIHFKVDYFFFVIQIKFISQIFIQNFQIIKRILISEKFTPTK